MIRLIAIMVVSFLAGLLYGCAFDVIHVKQFPTTMVVQSAKINSFHLDKAVSLSLGTGYSRNLREGTRWNYVGTIPQGDVYKTTDQVLTVEASNIHEAYVVIDASKLMGFYLPTEKSYSPLSDPVELSIAESKSNQ